MWGHIVCMVFLFEHQERNMLSAFQYGGNQRPSELQIHTSHLIVVLGCKFPECNKWSWPYYLNKWGMIFLWLNAYSKLSCVYDWLGFRNTQLHTASLSSNWKQTFGPGSIVKKKKKKSFKTVTYYTHTHVCVCVYTIHAYTYIHTYM